MDAIAVGRVNRKGVVFMGREKRQRSRVTREVAVDKSLGILWRRAGHQSFGAHSHEGVSAAA